MSQGFLNWVIFSLHVRQFALYLVIRCHSGRDKYFLHYSCFSKKLRILEGNCFFPRALSLHKYSQGGLRVVEEMTSALSLRSQDRKASGRE